MSYPTRRFPHSQALGAAAVISALALAAAACGSASTGSTSQSGASNSSSTKSTPGSITVVIDQDIPTVDGLYSNSAPVNQMIDASLTQVGLKGGVAPDLASSWSSNASATVWTFHLRPGLKFSNGAPLTAKDVVFSYKTIIANPKSLQNYYVQPVKTIVAHGPSTVVMTLKVANAAWDTQTTLIPVEPAATYNAKTFADHPIGAGPYKVVSYNGTNEVKMTLNPYYYGTKPAIKNAVLISDSNSTTLLDGLESGQYDAGLLSGPQVNVAKSAGLQVTNIPSSQVTYLGYNIADPVLSLDLRQAIGDIVNRAALVKTILLGQGSPTDQLQGSTVFGYDKSLQVPAQNLAKAKQLIAESGYHGQTIELDYPDGYLPNPPDLAQAIAGELGAAGIKVKLNEENSDTFLTAWSTSKLPAMYLFSIQAVTLDAGGSFLYFNNKALSNGANDPELLKLYNEQNSDTNRASRLQILIKDTEYINQKAYYTPLFAGDFSFVYNKKYHLATPPANGYPLPQAITGS